MIRQIQSTGNKALSFGKSKAKLQADVKNKTTFADIAGIEEAKEDLSEIIDKAEKQKVKIYTVGVGSLKGGLIPIKNRAGQVVDYVKDESGTDALSKLSVAALEQLALGTDGRFYLASSGGRVLRNLVEDITGLEKAELEGKLITQYEDRFQIPLIISLLFFMFEFVLSDLKGARKWRVFS